MIRFLSRYRMPIFVGTLAVFLIGTFVGLGGYLFNRNDMGDVAAKVGEDKIPMQRYTIQVRNLIERAREGGQAIDPAFENRMSQEVLRDLIVESLFAQEAETMGLKVSDREIAEDIKETFTREGRFDQRLYFLAVQNQFGMSPEQYEGMRRRSLLAFKYRQIVQRSVKVTPDEVKAAFSKENGGTKGFDGKKKEEYQARMQQQRALEVLNHVLRRLAADKPPEVLVKFNAPGAPAAPASN
jgi:parvulin-like peptidyl-prolyl isomerase